jgi:hypothetical protein
MLSLGEEHHLNLALQLAALAAISNLLSTTDSPTAHNFDGSLSGLERRTAAEAACSTAQHRTAQHRTAQQKPRSSSGGPPIAEDAVLADPCVQLSESDDLKTASGRREPPLISTSSRYHECDAVFKGEAFMKSDHIHGRGTSVALEAAHMSLSELHSIVGDDLALTVNERSSGGMIPEEVGLQDLLDDLRSGAGGSQHMGTVGMDSGALDEVPEEEEALLGCQHNDWMVLNERVRAAQREFLTALDEGMNNQVRPAGNSVD